MGSNLGGGPTRTGVNLFDVAVFVASELEAVDCPVADAAFFVRAFGAQLQAARAARELRRRGSLAAWA